MRVYKGRLNQTELQKRRGEGKEKNRLELRHLACAADRPRTKQQRNNSDGKGSN